MINLKPVSLIFGAMTVVAAPSAFAMYAPMPSVTVLDQISQLPTSWSYGYSVENQTTCFGNCNDTVLGKSIQKYVLAVRRFSVPYFSDAGISGISSPTGWSYQILPEDTFNLGFGASTLQWFATDDQSGIAMQATGTGFGYLSDYGPGKGPFSSQLGNGDIVLGDPAIPLSPGAIAAGLEPLSKVPEPASYLLMLAGVAALLACRTVRAVK